MAGVVSDFSMSSLGAQACKPVSLSSDQSIKPTERGTSTIQAILRNRMSLNYMDSMSKHNKRSEKILEFQVNRAHFDFLKDITELQIKIYSHSSFPTTSRPVLSYLQCRAKIATEPHAA